MSAGQPTHHERTCQAPADRRAPSATVAIGHQRWVIPDGYIPPSSTGAARPLVSHDALCILNTGDQDAQVRITVYFASQPPAGPYRCTVTARRTLHLRFNELSDPAPIPHDTDYASVVESDVPIIVQHTRLDSRQDALALMSTMAFPA
ncbi:MAG TPA: sensory rhodopsin transducer [Gemmatimonadales bacterium]|jgi:hypothetical protein